MKPQILLTNDDGIESPGLWAAAEALEQIGFVTVVAPREQSSGAGRSMPVWTDGIIQERLVVVRGKKWQVYAVGGTPAQAVQHAILEIMTAPPNLVVSGINYGENVTVGITVSGTVGAALEAASVGIPSIAISVEVPGGHPQANFPKVDFSVSQHYLSMFAGRVLNGLRIPDVDVIKIEIPADAKADTDWQMARLSRVRYYLPVAPERDDLGREGKLGFEVSFQEENVESDSDVYVLRINKKVAVTPISLDMTSRINLHDLENEIRASLSE
jgi:5'-nucleotidase